MSTRHLKIRINRLQQEVQAQLETQQQKRSFFDYGAWILEVSKHPELQDLHDEWEHAGDQYIVALEAEDQAMMAHMLLELSLWEARMYALSEALKTNPRYQPEIYDPQEDIQHLEYRVRASRVTVGPLPNAVCHPRDFREMIRKNQG
jgi:hypothetical protein